MEHPLPASTQSGIPTHISKVQTSPRPRKQAPHPRPLKKARGLLAAITPFHGVTHFLLVVQQAPSHARPEGFPVNGRHHAGLYRSWHGWEVVARHLAYSQHLAKLSCRVEEDFHQVPRIRVQIAHHESKYSLRERVELGKVVRGCAIFAGGVGFRSWI